MEEQSGKWNGVGPAGLSGLKVILTLLIEAIAVHVQVFIIEVGKPSFERLFARTKPVILFQQLDGGCISLQKLLAQPFGRTWNWGLSQSLGSRDRRRKIESITAFGGGSLWTSGGLIFTSWRRVTAGTAASVSSGHSLVER